MTTKLHINASQGIIDVEGDIEFVEKVYSDFKTQIESMLVNPPEPANPSINETPNTPEVAQKKTKTKKKAAKRPNANGSSKPAAQAYKPTIDKSVPLAGLAEFYSTYQPKNHSERILLFCKFLQDSGFETCTANQIYTCYVKTDPKNLPKAYPQALIDARGKDRGYIEYEKLEEVSVSHLGEHHLLTQMKSEA